MKHIVTLLFLLVSLPLYAQFPAPCDADKSCIGRAYTSTVSNGRGAHYVDIDKTAAQDSLYRQMTVEMWIKPTRQAGSRVYLGGLWGPRVDDNDAWVLYISPTDELVFEVNGDGAKLGATDNTIARASASGLYGKWSHIAAMFDGSTQTATLYINGAVVATGRNAQYPANYIRPLENKALLMQIGSTNAIAEDLNVNRTFVGQMDEIRIWNRTLTAQELYCNMTKSLNGNDVGLMMYYRCNETVNNFNLCDATGRGNIGRMRSGAGCTASDRALQQKVTKSLAFINEDLKCDSTKTWSVTITDTSICGSSVTLGLAGRDARFFRLSLGNVSLTPNTPVTYTITYAGFLTGNIQASVRMTGTNRCNVPDTLPITLNRVTELQTSKSRQVFDTIYAKCPSKLYIDSVIRVCNNTQQTATNRPITISGGTFLRNTGAFTLLPPAGKSFPVVLGVGECADFIVRFRPLVDTSFVYGDTLVFKSDDRCPGSGYVIVTGVIQEVFAILDRSGKKRITSFSFPAGCPNDIVGDEAWLWRNLTQQNVFVDSVRIPPTIVSVRLARIPPAKLVEPFLKASADNLQEKYFRFRPLKPGPVNDSIVFYVRLPGQPCQFVISIPFTGRGLDNDVEFSVDSLDFGNVVVGKQKTLPVTFHNKSTTDNMNITFYLKRGDEYIFPGAKTASLGPGQIKTINVTFMPTDSIWYFDQLCLFEQRCFTTQCIPVKGRGIIENFRFDPLVMRIQNVIGCRDSVTFVDIINESTLTQTLNSFVLNDPSGKFTHTDASGTAIPLPASVTLARGERRRFYFKFTPNNNTQDLAIRSYLQYKSSSGDDWSVQLNGTSTIPKLYVTPLTVFGTLEAGDTKRDTITIENTSPIPVRMDTIILPPGFSITWQNRTLPAMMQPRDSVRAEIVFSPTAAIVYDGKVTVKGEAPCPGIITTGDFKAKAVIVKLDAPVSIVNFSYVRPCDCITREVPLVNKSLVNDMLIDSLWIDSTRVPGGAPKFFSFSSYYYDKGGKVFPFSIPPKAIDTVKLVFCPRTPAETKFITSAARFNIKAHGAGWNAGYDIFLAGKRMMIFRPQQPLLQFPPTRVDTLSVVRRDTVTIPSVTDNPDQETIQIDSITYLPDERVFVHKDTANNDITFPVIIEPGKPPFRVNFYFKPRAPRQGNQAYRARAVLHYSKPCRDKDTTILLTGEGFAPAFGLQFRFDSVASKLDTFRITTCDTVRIPVYSSRDIPASLVDIQCRLGYDTTKLLFVGSESPYTSPKDSASPSIGRDFLLKNCRDVDSLKPFLIAKFVPRTPTRMTVPITVDSIFFDTEEVLYYKIVAGTDNAVVIVEQPDMKIQQPLVSFDSVRILDCTQRTFAVRNTGDMPITVDSLLSNLQSFTFVSSVPPRNQLIAPGDSSVVTVEFCPRNSSALDTMLYAYSTAPCTLQDSLRVQGKGYAPPFPVVFATDNTNFSAPADFITTLGDTLNVPVYVDKDFSTTYRGVTYWLKALNFNLRLQWNPFMLKYLSASSPLAPQMKVIDTIGFSRVDLQFSKVDDLKAGKIAELRFLVLVPDTVQDEIRITPSQFTTDSLLFLDIEPYLKTTSTRVVTNGKCKVTYLRYNSARPQLYQSVPNPATHSTTIRFDLQESVPAVLSVYSSQGELVTTLMNGDTKLEGGQYSVDFNTSALPAGVYTYVLRAGIFNDAKQLIVVK